MAAMLLVMLGCPSEYGRHGRIDQAMERDLTPDLPACPVGQHREKIDRDCQGERCPQRCIDDAPDGGH